MNRHTPHLLPILQAQRGDFDAVFFDIDGTLTDHGHALPGTAETLAWLRQEQIPFLCLTNDGNHAVTQKSAFLHRCGLQVAPTEIVSCAHAIFEHAESTGLTGKKVFIMGDLGVRFPPLDATADANRHDAADPIDSTVFCETHNLEHVPDCDGVIVGEGIYDWLPTITAVFNLLVRRPEVFMIVPNPDSYWPDGRRGLGIGAGAVARFIQRLLHDYGHEFEPVYLGKPYPRIFEHALHYLRHQHGSHLGADPSRIWVIGDSLSADIKGANGVGFRSVLVLTGITKAARLTENCRRTGVQPWLVTDGFGP